MNPLCVCYTKNEQIFSHDVAKSRNHYTSKAHNVETITSGSLDTTKIPFHDVQHVNIYMFIFLKISSYIHKYEIQSLRYIFIFGFGGLVSI